MYFCIRTVLSKSDAPSQEAVASHRAYLKAHSTRFLALGPTFGETGSSPEGSIYLLEAGDWDSARDFLAKDPLTISGARSHTEIWEWQPKGFDRRYPLDGRAI